MIKLLIDADTGVDDSMAILFALKRKDVKIVGITTGFGNTSASQAAENTLRLIKLAKIDYEIPVAIGADRPLVGERGTPPTIIHGDNGIGDAKIPPTDQKPIDEHASDFIVRMAYEHKDELTIVTLGRMTNLALALEKEPNLPKIIKNVVFMGGTYKAPGNVAPYSEANIAGDPEAADKVLLAGFDITMVGLDVTTKTRLTWEHLETLKKHASEECKDIIDYFLKAFIVYFDFNRVSGNALDSVPTHDPLAMLVAIDPSFVTIRKFPARVECSGTFTRGMIVPDYREDPIISPYLSICVDVDDRRAIEKILGVFVKRKKVVW